MSKRKVDVLKTLSEKLSVSRSEDNLEYSCHLLINRKLRRIEKENVCPIYGFKNIHRN